MMRIRFVNEPITAWDIAVMIYFWSAGAALAYYDAASFWWLIVGVLWGRSMGPIIKTEEQK